MMFITLTGLVTRQQVTRWLDECKVMFITLTGLVTRQQVMRWLDERKVTFLTLTSFAVRCELACGTVALSQFPLRYGETQLGTPSVVLLAWVVIRI